MKSAAALLFFIAAATTAPSADGAPPVLEYLHPSGGQTGTTLTVTAGGKFEPWPVKAWTDSPALRFEPGEKSGLFTVHIGAAVPPGPHLVRLHNGEGASSLCIFMVARQREIAEIEPNDEVVKPQSIDALPLIVNGQLEKSGDVDAFAVTLQAGQCLVASLQGRRLGAPMDPMLHLFDSAGNEIAFAHDGFGLDPVLVHRAPAAGTFVVRVSGFVHPPAADVRLAGAKNDTYRLTLTTGAFPRWACPAAVQRGTKTPLLLSGWNLVQTNCEIDAAAAHARQEHLPLPLEEADPSLRLQLSDGPELAESQLRPPQVLSAPFGVTGRLAADREEDRFAFTARKGQQLSFILRGGWIDSHFDPVLRIEDASGKHVARDDDGAGSGDARLEFTAPEDGTYLAVVGDLNRQGGDDFDYHLSVRTPLAGVTATVAAHELRIAPGKTASVKLSINRQNGHAADLVALAAGWGGALPPGITSSSAAVPAKSGEIEITLSAAADARAFSGPIRFMLLGTDPDAPFAQPAAYDLRKDNGQSFVDFTDAVWLTVLPPPATQPAQPPQAPAKK